MDRKTTHQANLVAAALSSTVVPMPALDAQQRKELILEALRDGRESQSSIARRFGVSSRWVSELYVGKVKAKPKEVDPDPAIAAAEERLAEAERQAQQIRLLAMAELYEAKARQCMREAQALEAGTAAAAAAGL